MANAIVNLRDLRNPGIEQRTYQEELPEHLRSAGMVTETVARMQRERAESLRQEADAMSAYADYMESAQVSPTIVGDLRTAADHLAAGARHADQTAEEYEAAFPNVQAAARTALSLYGEQSLPDFTRANS